MESVLSPEQKDEIYIAGGFSHPDLTQGIADEIGVDVGPVVAKIHPNGEIYSQIVDSVRGKHVFIVQPHVSNGETSVNDSLMQQYLLADAARSSSAKEITAVSPYLAYSRQDRKTKPREPIATRVIIDHLASVGVNRIVTVDMHSAQAQGNFRGPFDHLTAQPLLRQSMREIISQYDKDECLVVAPDTGAAKLSDRHRRKLDIGLLQLSKMRDPNDSQKIERDKNIPEADGRVCVLFDDMIDTAGTLVTAAEALKNSGANRIYVAATHGIFSDPAAERLRDAPIDKLLVTDTLPVDALRSTIGDKLQVVRVAPMIASALIEIVCDGSVSKIFDEQNHM